MEIEAPFDGLLFSVGVSERFKQEIKKNLFLLHITENKLQIQLALTALSLVL